MLPRQTQDSLQILWLAAYLMGLPPTGLYILSWTLGLTPMLLMLFLGAIFFQIYDHIYSMSSDNISFGFLDGSKLFCSLKASAILYPSAVT